MGLYLTIPEVVESETLISFSAGHDHLTFTVVMSPSETLVHLMHANSIGQNIPLVVLTTDSQIIALDSVFVSDASVSGDYGQVTFVAEDVRFV